MDAIERGLRHLESTSLLLPPTSTDRSEYRPTCSQDCKLPYNTCTLHRSLNIPPTISTYLATSPTSDDSGQLKMDTAPVIIGSNSRYSRKHDDVKAAAEKAAAQKKKRVPVVDVYNGEAFIQGIPLPLITRFSKRAAELFPKSGATTEGEGEKALESKLGNLNVGEQSGNEKTVTETTGNAVVTTKDSTANTDELVKDITGNEHKIMILGLDGVDEYPLDKSVKFCLDWFRINKHNSQILVPFYIPGSKVPLEYLIDLYAACLSFDMRPFPRQLRHEIYDLLTNNKPTPADIKCVFSRIPMDDSVVTRMATSYFEHFDKAQYSEDEVEGVKDAVGECGELWKRFDEIERTRWERQQKRRYAAGQAKLRRSYKELANEIEGAATATGANGQGQGRSTRNGGQLQVQAAGPATQVPATPAPAVGNGGSGMGTGGDAKRGAKKSTGKGVGARHVPGA